MSNKGEDLSNEDYNLQETSVEAWADDNSEPGSWLSAAPPILQGTDWTVETLVNQIQRGNIDLAPAFQRREVWNQTRMSRFVESLMVGVPVPQIVLAASKTRRGGFIVLDGKQRLTAISRWAADTESEARPLRLKGLDILNDYEGKTLAELREMPEAEDDLRLLDNTTIRTVVIANWPSEEYLSVVFNRLNSGSVALSTQELRHALYPGPFASYIDNFAYQSEPLREALRLSQPDFRMRDTELALRFLAMSTRLNEYAGALSAFLDSTMKFYNSDWANEKITVRTSLSNLELALESSREVFGKSAFRRVREDGSYETLFNRAVFDCQALLFSQTRVRDFVAMNPDGVKKAFEQLSMGDVRFQASLTATTKSIGSTHYRLFAWTNKLNESFNLNIETPRIENNRIAWDLA